MQEYIFYVVLVFLPIGAVMAYLLRKENLAWSYIVIIEAVSLLVIISFPISMENLGVFLSFAIYIVCLLLLTGYFLYSQKDSSVIPEQSSNASALLPAEQGQIDNKDDNFASIPLITPEQETSSIETTDKQIIINDSPVAENAHEDDEQQFKDNMADDETQGDLIQGIGHTDLESDDIEYFNEDNVQEIENVEIKPDIIDDNSENKAELITIKISPEEILAEEVDKGNTEEIADYEIIIKETDEGEVTGTEVYQGNEDLNVEDEPLKLDITEKSKNAPVNNAAGTEENIVPMLIDSGFSCRNDKLQEAGEYFARAWHLTSDNELKYLLTIELSQIYKESGQYSKAEEILRQFAVSIDERPDIIEEIHRQLTEIKLLVTELNRLGLGELPLSRIPRWIRLKVGEEMTTQGQ